MQNGNSKIDALFNGDRIFKIPKYQRAFSWDENNLEDFFDDLLNQRGDKSYFLGTLLFHEQGHRADYEILDVVDGQQRLTTIMIFIYETIIELNKRKSTILSERTFKRYIYDGENYKLELENEDSVFLHNYIFNEANPKILETPSQRLLLKAKKYFRRRIGQISLDELERIFVVLKEADVILYIVNNISDANQIFELLNNRGKQLTNLEEIKSFLMYRIGSLDLKDREQPTNDIHDSFSTIYRIIERYEIPEDDVLRFHTIAFEKSKTDDYNAPTKFIKNKINKLFFKSTIQDNEIRDEILEYVKKLKRSFDIYKEIKTNALKSIYLDQMEMIGRVNPFYPLLMIIYDRYKSDFIPFVKDLIKFSFRATLIGLRNDNEGFYRYIRDNEDFRDLFKWILDGNWWNIKNRTNEVLKYRNFFEWVNKNTVKYILFSYENYLREQKGYPLLTKKDYFSTDTRKKLSIEHITAQHLKNFTPTEKFVESYLHSLGNLVIDTKSANSRKGNKTVNKKMREYTHAPLMSQNEIKESNVNWKNIADVKKFIDDRNKKIVRFIKEKLI